MDIFRLISATSVLITKAVAHHLTSPFNHLHCTVYGARALAINTIISFTHALLSWDVQGRGSFSSTETVHWHLFAPQSVSIVNNNLILVPKSSSKYTLINAKVCMKLGNFS